jgi:LysM repeat protein
VVEPGDTLRGIAQDFDISVEALLDANGLTPAEGDEIRPGQELIIP